LSEQGGGPVATALVTLARFGMSTAFLGVIGGDPYADRIRASLVDEGIDLSLLQVDADGSSQVAFIAVDSQAQRTIFWSRGSKRGFSLTPAAQNLISTAALLHLDGLDVPASVAAARIARQAGVPTLLDAGTWRPEIIPLLPLIDHLVVSEGFARVACGMDQPGAGLEWLLDQGGETATITCGVQGAWSLERGGERFHQPAFYVPAIDTTGCGDVFHGGYAFGLLKGWPLQNRVRFASAAAALKTRCMGGRSGIPSLNEVHELLQTDFGK